MLAKVVAVTRWNEERDRAVAARAAALDRQLAADAARAREVIADFLTRAKARGLRPEPLHCTSYDGRARYRTALRGWFLNQARTIALDVDGNYYTLTVPRSARARFRGADPQPQEPKLVVGEGSRDGESMPLRDLLTKLLTP